MGVQSPSTLPTDPTTGDYMGPPSNFYLNLQYIVHTVACDSPSWWSPLEV